MNDDLATWLAARQPPPPAPLAAALEAGIVAAERLAGDVPAEAARLAAAGMAALRRALLLGDVRPAAYELLTADALLTYAVERAAEDGLPALAALLDALTPAALHELAGGRP